MNIEIINKIDEIINIIENDKDIIKMKKLKTKLLNNKELMRKINILKEMDKYNEEYISLKKEILSNEDYSSYKTLENDLYLFIKEINSHLNTFLEKSGCK
ncbi:MAG: YlbF family regulator [Bacilli bacterium]|nr:YlbF family regulator [Bacilli bacterium]